MSGKAVVTGRARGGVRGAGAEGQDSPVEDAGPLRMGPDEYADRVRDQLVKLVGGLDTGELLRLTLSAEASEKRDRCTETEMVELIHAFKHSGLSEFSETCNVGDLAAFIWNSGETRDAVDGFVALLPIARRVWDRMPVKEK